MTQQCERTWRVAARVDFLEPRDTYRQHRCGVVGPHTVHTCRYCGRDAVPLQRNAQPQARVPAVEFHRTDRP